MALAGYTSWSVPSGDTIDIAATINSNGNTLRCGPLIGQFGSRYLNYPVPFYAQNGSTFSPNAINLSHLGYTFEVVDAQSSTPICVVLQSSNGMEVFGATFSLRNLPYPRQNALYARVIRAGSPYPSVGPSGDGFLTTNYYETSSGAFALWGTLAVSNAPPYYTLIENYPYSVLMPYLS